MAGNDSYTKILLHMDGSNGGTSFIDSAIGGSAHTWTANSATTDTGTVKFGSASQNCGASVGWVDTPDHSDFTLGSGDFTIEAWVNRQGGSGTRRIIGGQIGSAGATNTCSAYLEMWSTNVLKFTVCNGSTNYDVFGSTAITSTGWHHVAGVRTGNTLRLFVDGVQEGGDVAFSVAVNNASSKYSVGRVGEYAGLYWYGFIDEFRLSVGIARWTANFTPPTSAYQDSTPPFRRPTRFFTRRF